MWNPRVGWDRCLRTRRIAPGRGEISIIYCYRSGIEIEADICWSRLGKLNPHTRQLPITAKDGVDALEQMKNVLPSILLVDIEMPRMDGFDLARHVRSDPVTRHLPIVVISSRTADKHRNQAAQLGVNAFLGKPYSEAELLRHVAELIAPGSHAAAA